MKAGHPETPNQIAICALERLEREDQLDKYVGVLLCEGVWGGIDVTLYQEVFPQLLVIPCGGCEHVLKHIAIVRKRLYDYPVMGLIDRDSRTKKDIRELKKNGIYCTKLPFIENIISCPEIIKIVAPKRGMDPDELLEKLQRNLIGMLCKKIRNSLPLNITFADEDTQIFSVMVRICSDKNEVVEKLVDRDKILYAYRDKSVANEAAFLLGLNGRKNYYDFFMKCLNDQDISESILKCANKYLPEIVLEEITQE